MSDKSRTGGSLQYGDDAPQSEPNYYQRVYALVRQVPEGKVVTYGQVATLLGQPRGARAVGYALRYLPAEWERQEAQENHGPDVPWHRVVNHRGEISPRYPAAGPVLQRRLLEAEGIPFDAQDRIDLAVYRWHPDTDVSNPG